MVACAAVQTPSTLSLPGRQTLTLCFNAFTEVQGHEIGCSRTMTSSRSLPVVFDAFCGYANQPKMRLLFDLRETLGTLFLSPPGQRRQARGRAIPNEGGEEKKEEAGPGCQKAQRWQVRMLSLARFPFSRPPRFSPVFFVTARLVAQLTGSPALFWYVLRF